MSALSIYTGPRSAKERASDRWNTTELPQDEHARHVRLMNAIRRIEEGEIMQENPRDMYKWRRAYNAHLKKELRDKCRMCKGTGEITVDDGAGGVDFDACPRCSWFEPYADDYPTAGDVMDIPF